MEKNYLKEMCESGLRPEEIGVFPRLCFSYLADKFFPEKESKILDIGAGQGHFLFLLKERGWSNLWAADIDDFNRDLFEKNKINFIKIDLEKNKFQVEDCFFDVVLAFHLIEHLKDPTNFLTESYRMLKEGGILILVTPDWRKQYRTFWHDPTHTHPFDKESIARILRIFKFSPFWIKSYGVLKGFGRTHIWEFIKPLMFIGCYIIAVSKKSININGEV